MTHPLHARMQKIHPERGATLVEFAFVGFLFFVVLFGIIEWSSALFIRNSNQHLSRCIAREAVIRGPDQSGADAAKDACLFSNGASLWWPLHSNNLGNYFEVTYCNKDDGCASARTLDQLSVCPDSDECVKYVQVKVADGAGQSPFRVLAGFLGVGSALDEPPTVTWMPAESMGYTP